MYANESPKSEKYQEFLKMIGKEITLQNYKGFRGGLDVKKDTTGKTTIANTIYFSQNGVLIAPKNTFFFEDFVQIDVMFHVATMLPSNSAENNHHLGKKRHIGNDGNIIIFYYFLFLFYLFFF